MNYIKLILLLCFLSISCSYPDIDSVPTFEKLQVNKEESIDLCNLSNNDNKEALSECLDSIIFDEE